MTTHMTSWSKMSLQKKWKQTASTGGGGGGSGTTSPRMRKMRQRGCTQSEAREHAHGTTTAVLLLRLCTVFFTDLNSKALSLDLKHADLVNSACCTHNLPTRN
jgi:hypothetical protein